MNSMGGNSCSSFWGYLRDLNWREGCFGIFLNLFTGVLTFASIFIIVLNKGKGKTCRINLTLMLILTLHLSDGLGIS